MREHIVIAHYPESDWDDDIVRFQVPEHIRESTLRDEIDCQKCSLEKSEYDSLQDYADALFTKVADELGGTWSYLAQCGVISITDD